MGKSLSWIGGRLARYLAQPMRHASQAPPSPMMALANCLQPADVLLVEGHSRFSTAIKYLTQSTWSHSSLYVGFRWRGDPVKHDHCFIEADVVQGVRSVGLEEYRSFHTRICRPVGLTQEAQSAVCDFAAARLGHQYDLRNVFDLMRYLLPTPPVPQRFRRKMLSFGSGDPTRAICSTLIAQAFQSIHYPILPMTAQIGVDAQSVIEQHPNQYPDRHYSHFTPRDFDVSPYFKLIKPTLESGFSYDKLPWVMNRAENSLNLGQS